MLGGSRSVHFLSFLVIVRLVPHGNLLCLLFGQRFSVSTTVPGRCVYYVAVRLLFQSGQQPNNVFCYPRILHTRMLAAVAPATEHMIVVAAQRRKDFCSSSPSLRSRSITVESCLINSSLCFPACRFSS